MCPHYIRRRHCYGRARWARTHLAPSMDASLYFQLVDAIANARSPREISAIADRVAATHMHPLERRVLDRALRARTEALDLQDPVLRRVAGGRDPDVRPGAR